MRPANLVDDHSDDHHNTDRNILPVRLLAEDDQTILDGGDDQSPNHGADDAPLATKHARSSYYNCSNRKKQSRFACVGCPAGETGSPDHPGNACQDGCQCVGSCLSARHRNTGSNGGLDVAADGIDMLTELGFCQDEPDQNGHHQRDGDNVRNERNDML